MSKKMKCSICGKRAFDISKLPKEEIVIKLKCPHCKNLTNVKCDSFSMIISEKIEVKK